jgi:cytoskeletal protein RodZ
MFSKIINKAVKRMADHTQQTEEGERTGAVQAEGVVDIGEQLRSQRKARGISLIEISEHTKIGKKYLEALEEGRYDLLPCETYIRGFLRAYAKYLELDDEQILRQYKEERRVLKGEREVQKSGEEEGRTSNQSIWLPLLSLLLLAGVGAGLFLFWPSSSGTPRETVHQAAAVAEPTAGVSSGMAPGMAPGLAPQAPPSVNVPGPNEEMSLTVKAKEKTWITVMADGRQEPDVTLNSGEEQSWKAKERFVLWTGNAGGIEVIFNGEMQPPLGKVGEVRKEVVFERKPPAAQEKAINPMSQLNPGKAQ